MKKIEYALMHDMLDADYGLELSAKTDIGARRQANKIIKKEGLAGAWIAYYDPSTGERGTFGLRRNWSGLQRIAPPKGVVTQTWRSFEYDRLYFCSRIRIYSFWLRLRCCASDNLFFTAVLWKKRRQLKKEAVPD